MSSNDSKSASKKRKKSGKKLYKISFDEEIVTKDVAQQLNNVHALPQEHSAHSEIAIKKPKKVKHKATPIAPVVASEGNTELSPLALGKQKRKRKRVTGETNVPEDQEPAEEEQELNPANPVVKQGESIRAKKRKRHQRLLLEKKVKVDLAMQTKCLNYLSQWKHNRYDWKFEKLRQVWLQQNMFDCDKVPDQFWETLVEYFSSAKGKIRKTIIENALKIIEKTELEVDQVKGDETKPKTNQNEDEAEDEEEDDADNNYSKAQRAKSIIQSLQE